MKLSKKIIAIRFKREIDECPDLSHIGEYTDRYDDWVIVCRDNEYLAILQENEDWTMPCIGHEARFFKPHAGEAKEGTEDYQKNGKQDYELMAAYNRYEWYMVHCFAVAKILVNETTQELGTAGVWGVSSNSGEDDFLQIKQEEFAELNEILLSVGFSDKEISEAFERAKNEAL